MEAVHTWTVCEGRGFGVEDLFNPSGVWGGRLVTSVQGTVDDRPQLAAQVVATPGGQCHVLGHEHHRQILAGSIQKWVLAAPTRRTSPASPRSDVRARSGSREPEPEAVPGAPSRATAGWRAVAAWPPICRRRCGSGSSAPASSADDPGAVQGALASSIPLKRRESPVSRPARRRPRGKPDRGDRHSSPRRPPRCWPVAVWGKAVVGGEPVGLLGGAPRRPCRASPRLEDVVPGGRHRAFLARVTSTQIPTMSVAWSSSRPCPGRTQRQLGQRVHHLLRLWRPLPIPSDGRRRPRAVVHEAVKVRARLMLADRAPSSGARTAPSGSLGRCRMVTRRSFQAGMYL